MYIDSSHSGIFNASQDVAIDSKTIGRPEYGLSSPNVLGEMEALLWAELLSHTGFEDALVHGAGGHASGFSRLILEHVAADLAESQPLGLGREVARAYGLIRQD